LRRLARAARLSSGGPWQTSRGRLRIYVVALRIDGRVSHARGSRCRCDCGAWDGALEVPNQLIKDA
jgi:hypothetical protein